MKRERDDFARPDTCHNKLPVCCCVPNHTYQHTHLCLLSAHQQITVTISNASVLNTLPSCLTNGWCRGQTDTETVRPELSWAGVWKGQIKGKKSFNNIVMWGEGVKFWNENYISWRTILKYFTTLLIYWVNCQCTEENEVPWNSVTLDFFMDSESH